MIAIVAATALTSADLADRQPDFVVTSYQQIEVMGKNGLPDFNATSNHWQKRVEHYFIVQDSRTMRRESDGSATLTPVKFEWKDGPQTVTQAGEPAPGCSTKFKWVCQSPGVYAAVGGGAGEFASQKVVKCAEIVSFVLVSDVEEVERRSVNGQTVTRVRDHREYSVSMQGMGRGDDFNPMRPAGMQSYKPTSLK